MKILREELDMAAKVRVWVGDENESIMLKYDERPKDEEIVAEAERTVASRTTVDMPVADDLIAREAALDAREVALNEREAVLAVGEAALAAAVKVK